MSTSNPLILQNNNKKNGHLLSYLLLLTAVFFLMQVSYFFEMSGFYLFDFKGMTRHLEMPFHVFLPSFLFIIEEIVLHVLFTLLVWASARLVAIACNLSWKRTEQLGFCLWGFSLFTLILANQYFYPNSKFSCLTASFLNEIIASILLSVCSLILSIVFIFTLFGLIKLLPNMLRVLLLGFFLSCTLAYYTYSHNDFLVRDASTVTQPNIILIGIDSLRPDFLGFFGHEANSPHLDQFLNESTVFSEALTPLARTFPAWVSILTGEYPKQNGVRTNLQDTTRIDLRTTLSALLQQKGYETIFATDETRFSNIDRRFGFDHVIVPTVGLDDFLLGTLNDFPLSNMIINTKLGKWLFPDSYGNRPAYATYSPNSFLNLLKPVLKQPRNKPLFLAVHFCLPHSPYIFGRAASSGKSLRDYNISVHRVDQQFNDFLKLLHKNKLLNHAVVVILSDHGEAIELHNDRVTDPELFIAGKNNLKKIIPAFYPPTFDQQPVDKSAGHGTDVLGLTQYHTLLAVQLFGLPPNQKNVISGPVSLLDIKPTALAYAGLKDFHENGYSLKKWIDGNYKKAITRNDFFMESDFSPEAIRTIHPETRQVLFEGINYFQMDPKTTRFTVRKNMLDMILASKQYADLYHGWILALYPQTNKTLMPILVNLNTGYWTNDLRTPFAINSPANHMLMQMKHFFKNDLTPIQNEL